MKKLVDYKMNDIKLKKLKVIQVKVKEYKVKVNIRIKRLLAKKVLKIMKIWKKLKNSNKKRINIMIMIKMK